MSATVETEIKLEVPTEAREAVKAALCAAQDLHRTRLQAVYVDTADQRLAVARMALRLRREGPRWVQTLKAGGALEMARLEHNVDLGEGDADPAVDPCRHAGTEVGARLLALLADGAPLQARYRTDILRLHRVVETGAASIELAFDEGAVEAGTERWPVCELELELQRGDVGALFAEAQRWVDRHGLWLDVRSKAERGERLARGARLGDAVPAGRITLPRELPPGVALRATMARGLRQVLANAADVADGRYTDAHRHQLRVGLRRLRGVLRCFASADAGLDPAWPAALARLSEALGAPPGDLSTPPPGPLLRAAATTRLWLRLQAFALSPAPDAEPTP